MTEFETTLKEYRKLVEQIADERGFLDFLQGQLTEVEEKLKSLACSRRSGARRGVPWKWRHRRTACETSGHFT